jgi:hypothetical protein
VNPATPRPTRVPGALASLLLAALAAACGAADTREEAMTARRPADAAVRAGSGDAPAPRAGALPGAPEAPAGLRLATFAVG